jgi:hypothetical protein
MSSFFILSIVDDLFHVIENDREMVIENHHEVSFDAVDTNVFLDLWISKKTSNLDNEDQRNLLTGFKCIKLQKPPRGQSLKKAKSRIKYGSEFYAYPI